MEIGVWGDSVTYGSCDEEAMGWVGRLRKSFPIHDNYHQVYNFGICGETTTDLSRRFDVESRAVKPDLIILAIGINDTKYQSSAEAPLVSKEESVNNLRTLIIGAQEITHNVIVVGPTNVDESWRSSRGSRFLNEVIQDYNKAFKVIADECGAPFVEVFGSLDPTSDLADGLHPNAAGYVKLYTIIKKYIPAPV